MFDLDFADIKPSVLNWLLVGLMAASFIAAGKFAVNRWNNPATAFFRDFFNAL